MSLKSVPWQEGSNKTARRYNIDDEFLRSQGTLFINTVAQARTDREPHKATYERVGRYHDYARTYRSNTCIYSAHQIPPGIYPDMTKHGWDNDDWPAGWKRVLAADILVIGTPLWLGEESSVCRVLIERALRACRGELNDKGQSIYYGKCARSV